MGGILPSAENAFSAFLQLAKANASTLPVVYRTIDDVSNLCVRVNLRRCPTSTDPAVVLGESEHTFEFRWQQKVFGPRELLRIAGHLQDMEANRQPRGGFSPLEREYMSLLKAKLDSGQAVFDAASSVMMFTYTDRDDFIPPSELQRTLVHGGDDAERELPSSQLTAAVLNPLADPRGVIAHAYKERPYSTMYVMAAVGINKEDYRAKKLDTKMFEVPLVMIRVYAPDPAPEGGGPPTYTVEMRPGYTDTLPVDSAGLSSLAAAGISHDSVLGEGKFGGELRLKTVTIPKAVLPELPPQLTIRSPEGIATTAMVEVHSFRTPDAVKYEYTVVNPSEDTATAVLAAQAATAVGDPALAIISTLTAPLPTSLVEQSENVNDPLASLIHADRRAMAALAHRSTSDCTSSIPLSATDIAFRTAVQLEIVACVDVTAADRLYVAWELQLPTGWTLLYCNADNPEQPQNEYMPAKSTDPKPSRASDLASSASRDTSPVTAGITQVARSKRARWTFEASGAFKHQSYLFPGVRSKADINHAAVSRRASFRSKDVHTSIVTEDAVDASVIFSGVDERPVAYIGYPLELHFTCDHDVPVEYPMIHFKVLTQDQWERDHLVGIGSFSIPYAPGSLHESVPLWLPHLTLREQEADFFLGNVASTCDGHKQRAGVSGASIGSIALRVNCARVRKLKPLSKPKASDSLTKVQAIATILARTTAART